MDSKKYIPIDCNFYDELVLLAMRKTPIILMPNVYNLPEGDYIKDLITTPEKEEFMVMNTGNQLRLDKISSLDGNILFLHLDEAFSEEEE